ncbi:MAG: Cupin 4 family protein [Pseudonocardiales bacterium]|nr:Cupin 4 family protein [Pseudonocardiales bacterium]
MDVAHDVFAEKYWSRAPLLTQGRPPDAFFDLFDERAVDSLVSEHGLRTPFVRMAKNGEVVAGKRFTRSGGAGATIADQLADDKVLGLLADGTTLVLQALHRTWPPLIRFGTALAAELGHPVQINAYITPPQNQGFAAHYDNHDVFVLQIAGRKQWRIHEPVLADPLPHQKWEQRRADVAARATEAPLIDTVLSPGDSLYLPRGYLHSASALGELTIHLTVGVHPLTQNSLLQRLVEVVGTGDGLRGSLPMGVDLSDPAVLGPQLAEVAHRLAEFAAELNPQQTQQIATKMGAALAEDTRPEPIGPLAQGAAAASLTGRTRLRVRSGLRYAFTAEPDRCTLQIVDRTITLPAIAHEAMPAILDGVEFVVDELAGLGPSSQRTLVLQLLREGVVVPVVTG